jgi:nucleotide-binding universal stress UspA family protein
MLPMMAESAEVGPVVVGIDGSEAGYEALRHAVREAGWRGVALHVVHVLDVTPAVLHLEHDQTINTRELAESDRTEIWRRAAPILDEAGPEVVRVERDGNPGKTLVAYCAEAEASALVVGQHGRGMVEKLFAGSTADASIKDAHCDVLLVKQAD